jgi:hypothetical protein
VIRIIGRDPGDYNYAKASGDIHGPPGFGVDENSLDNVAAGTIRQINRAFLCILYKYTLSISAYTYININININIKI